MGSGQRGHRNLHAEAWRDAPAAFYRAVFPAQNGWGTKYAAHRITLPSRNTTVAADVAVTITFFDALPAGSAQRDSVLVMRDVSITWNVPKETTSQSTGPKPLVRSAVRSTLTDNR